jgi:hypothetical protein
VLLAALRAAAPHERRLEELVCVDPPRVAAVLTGGRLRRRMGRLLLDVPGRRARLTALTEIVRSPPPLATLELDPIDMLALVAALIEPEWTAGERFTVAYRRPAATRPEALLRVADASRPTVSAPLVPAIGTSTIVCPPSALSGVLAGPEPALAMLEGEEQPVLLLRRWIARAQSG